MACAANMYEHYKDQSILTMTPGELLIRLYDELSFQLNLSIKNIDDKNLDLANKSLIKSQNIILYLSSTLNKNYPISNNLFQLYDFFNYQLIKANLSKNKQDIQDVLNMVNSLRDTWKQAEKLSRMR